MMRIKISFVDAALGTTISLPITYDEQCEHCHDNDYVEKEISEIKKAIGKHILKVIFECCLLTKDEIVTAAELSKKAGADFVKTSTGFSISGAKIEDVELMRKTVGPQMGVKAAGGIRTFDDLKAMLNAGATRIGASHATPMSKIMGKREFDFYKTFFDKNIDNAKEISLSKIEFLDILNNLNYIYSKSFGNELKSINLLTTI